jgi:hypothetical protein
MGIKEQLADFEAKLTKGLSSSFAKMLEMKRSKNSPVIIIKKGRILAVNAEEFTS